MPEQESGYQDNKERLENEQRVSEWDELVNEGAGGVSGGQDTDDNAVGAKALTRVGFHQGRHSKEIVGSSFEKSRRRGEKLENQKPAERRNEAYLSRIERAVDKYGDRLEKRLWGASAKKLIVREEDIPESYWKSQEQILRDEGRGNIKIGDYEKQELVKSLQEHQRESLKSWSDYLGHEECPYPMWFKLYAWDGMSKMGTFDKEKGEFRKRDKSTVAPYPKLNPAVLAKVYSAVSNFYGVGEGRIADTKLSDEQLESLVASGNFNRLYSKLLLEQKAAPEVPKNPEDVRGNWIEYRPGDEEKLAVAAEGTPWCVADPSVGRNYMEYGEYGVHDDYGGNYENSGNKAKFILLHLEDPETGALAENACASIRLNTDGRVAEISGLREGQVLDDALVPVVEEKVKTLSGGEEFLEAFADKKKLIELDRKMQAGEDLTKEEYEFLYEINRPIRQLDTYRDDPRINELKEKYDVGKALDCGINVDDLVPKLYSEDIVRNLDTLINHGANIDIDNLVSRLGPFGIVDNLDTLIDHGADIDIDDLVPKLYPEDIADNFDTLINHGANIDNLVSRFYPEDIAHNLDTLINHGANIDIDNLVSRLGPFGIVDNLDTLINHGANIDNLVSRFHPEDIAHNLDTLIDYGADIDIDNLVSRLGPFGIADNLDTLIDHGADIDNLVSRLYSEQIADNLDTLIDHGANIDIDNLVSRLDLRGILYNLDTLINHGADVNAIRDRGVEV